MGHSTNKAYIAMKNDVIQKGEKRTKNLYNIFEFILKAQRKSFEIFKNLT